MVPQQPVVEWYLDRALQQVERTHFTIVTCRSVLEGHISPSSLVALFLSTLHYSEHSNHPFCSFSAFFFGTKPFSISTLDVSETNCFDLVTFFPPFPFAFFGGSLKSCLSELLSQHPHSEHQGSLKHNGFDYPRDGKAALHVSIHLPRLAYRYHESSKDLSFIRPGKLRQSQQGSTSATYLLISHYCMLAGSWQPSYEA